MLLKGLISASAPLAKRALTMNFTRAALMPHRLAHHDVPADCRPPTMDELTVPCGCWKEHYENQQRKYNLRLISGAGFFLITVMAVFGSGRIDFYFLFPPPAPRSAVTSSSAA